MESLEGRYFDGCDLYNWYYKYDSYESSIDRKEILDY